MIIWTIGVGLNYGQPCEKSFHLDDFTTSGFEESFWQVEDSADVSNIGYFFDPTFYVSPEKMINVLVKGTISVETNNDNDFVGIVFGYQKPTNLGTDLNYNFYLFDWKSETESFKFNIAYEGFRLSKYAGLITEAEIGKYFWGSEDLPPKRLLYAVKKGDNLGWEPFRKYDFELLYTVNLIRIKIDGQIIFERSGCYEAGNIGFYCMSQDRGRFEDFSYRFKAESLINPDAACVGEPVYFESFDPLCTAVPSNVESITWDFGDGQSSDETNPYHTFSDPGDYSVELRVKTLDGCMDTVRKTVTINPNPKVSLGNDTTLSFFGSISLDAGNDGSEYLWSTQSNQQTIDLENLIRDTTVWVEVNKNGCLGADTLRIFVEKPPRSELSFPNAFTPNGDGMNDVFEPVGMEQLLINYQMFIYDRWGRLIFESSDFYQGWDGTFKGKNSPVGVYVYRVNYTSGLMETGIEDYSENGTITLVR